MEDPFSIVKDSSIKDDSIRNRAFSGQGMDDLNINYSPKSDPILGEHCLFLCYIIIIIIFIIIMIIIIIVIIIIIIIIIINIIRDPQFNS
jgi:hypothetical protein